MKCWLTYLMAAISVALCVLTAYLWWGSSAKDSDIGYSRAAGRAMMFVGVSSTRGKLIFTYFKGYYDEPVTSDDQIAGFHWTAVTGNGRLWSFAFASWAQMQQQGACWGGFGVICKSALVYKDHSEDVIALMAPDWSVVLASLIFPAYVGVRRFLARPRKKYRRCMSCRYDLRAHHPGDKCPECGTVSKGPSTA